MVFSSFEFLYLFMPIVFLGFVFLRYKQDEMGIILWLIIASLAFYGYWNPIYLGLIIASLIVNWFIGCSLQRAPNRWLLVAGVAGNIATLGWFKYATFVADNINSLTGSTLDPGTIFLPLAISFFTFQQIAFLVDSHRGQALMSDFLRYVLFIVFFPQLIAGPIVMQKDTIPQFKLSVFQSRLATNVAVGLALLVIGLFKKLVVADTMAQYANPVFDLADQGYGIPPLMAWSGTLAYTVQIYFDFSGYSDMALGLARMFGIRLPMNFNSPYKATSISDFWRRWHMTLSRFLRDYVYIPLGGNRKGPRRQSINLAATMLLGGLWHGAHWNFVIWGALHGLYLSINHAWSSRVSTPLPSWFAGLLTFLSVVVAWVFFRATTFDGAMTVLVGMIGAGPVEVAEAVSRAQSMTSEGLALSILFILAAWTLPNALQITRRHTPALEVQKVLSRKIKSWQWRPTPRWSAVVACVAFVSVIQMYRLGDLSEFIYFQF